MSWSLDVIGKQGVNSPHSWARLEETIHHWVEFALRLSNKATHVTQKLVLLPLRHFSSECSIFGLVC
jgi:hypothetical protein